jgi:uncharacterized protein YqgC (DUF456 family)
MDWLQSNGIWVVTFSLIIFGLIGSLLPVIPGQLLIIVAAGAHWWAKGEDASVQWWTFLVLGLLYGTSQLMEYVSGGLGSKYFGGTGWGVAGAIVGGLAGLFFPPWGFLAGPLAGAFCFEYFFAQKELEEASRSGVGSAVGAAVGIVIKLGIALLMAGYLVADLFWF